MSENQALDIGSFFDKQQSKKQKNQQQQQQQKKKAEEQQRKLDEEKKAEKTGDFESSDEEDSRAQIEVGSGKVKDIKEVNKEKQLQKDAQREQDFSWNYMDGDKSGSGHQAQHQSAAPKEEKPHPDGKGGFARDVKKSGVPLVSTSTPSLSSSQPQFQKDGIVFTKGKPSFKKSENVGKLGDFPELGDVGTGANQTKAAVGGAIGQVSAPAKGARTQNTFDILKEDGQPKRSVPFEETKTESDAPKERPRFSGLKGFLNKQADSNAEANKGLADYQKKVADTMIIHEAKPVRKEGVAGEEEHQKSATVPGEVRERHIHKKIDESSSDEDEGFEQVEGDKRRAAGERRGGRGGRGGFPRTEEGERKPRIPFEGVPQTSSEDKPRQAPAAGFKPSFTNSAPKREEKPKASGDQTNPNFSGWTGVNM